jgi:phosphoglycerate kinase
MIRYIDQMQLTGKKVLIRVDFNVPYDKEMKITDDTRITATVPTIEYCIKNNCTTILVSHLGRPDGKVVPKMSLKPVAERLAGILNKKVVFIDTPVGDALKAEIDKLQGGDVALLENIRYYPEEEKNDAEFGKKLASLCDVYLNDAFATAHRGHASNEAITHYVKECAAGFLLKDEIEYFKKAMEHPKRPLAAVIGGAKVSGKLEVLSNILTKVDVLIIGGGMAFTFLKAKGYEIGKSILEANLVDTAKKIMDEAAAKKIEILLPVDVVIADEFKNESPKSIVPVDQIPAAKIGLDIGPKSIELFSNKIKGCKTVVWNGPMGAFEMSNFADGTNAVAKVLSESDVLSIVGGGDSVTAVHQAGVADKISYISTGGGAFLELLEGKTLPAIKALDR